MTITEEQYHDITSELDADIFSNLSTLALNASGQSLSRDLDHLHELAKRALDYSYNENTHDKLEKFYEEIDDVRSQVMNSIELLEKIEEVLSDADDALLDRLYVDDLED